MHKAQAVRSSEANLLQEILGNLSEEERKALCHYYELRKTPEQIYQTLGIHPDRQQALRMRVREAFFDAKRRWTNT